MMAVIATLFAVAFGVSLGWIARGEHDTRKRKEFPAAERFRATKAANRDKLKPSSASVRGALREGER